MIANEMRIVVFKLLVGEDYIEFGLPIEQVQEINRLLTITKMPQTPDFVEGIVNLRGHVIPVIDLNKRFFMMGGVYTDRSRIIMCDISNQSIGVIVDEVTEVLLLSSDAIEDTTDVIGNISNEYIQGIAKVGERLIILLNLEMIFSKSEHQDLIMT